MNHDTIVAPATASGVGAIALIRLSGEKSIRICDQVYSGHLQNQESHTVSYGFIMDGADQVDEVMVSVFKAPKSFTTEDVVEISCHGSDYIVRTIIQLLIDNGARSAEPGEFTKRAFVNGRLDLSQAEAVADIIASDSEASRKAALNQLKGGFSEDIKALREKLIEFASLVELELDFSEEDVEFADRSQLSTLVEQTSTAIKGLLDSFVHGSALKEGYPIAIIGKPNAGKSTLLNTLLNEEKAIVTPVPGTTRDFIEDQLVIDGFKFRFIDTAGIRETEDIVEAAGVERSIEQMKKAFVVLYVFDALDTSRDELDLEIKALEHDANAVYSIGNKTDLGVHDSYKGNDEGVIWISAREKTNISQLTDILVTITKIAGTHEGDTIVTSSRHYEKLSRTFESLERVKEGIENNLETDLLAMDIREALHFLGEITGEITTDDLLATIFSKFCIGK